MDEVEKQIEHLERRLALVEGQLRTLTSSPQDDVLGSPQRSFTKHYLKGSGHVSEITLGSDGESLSFRKVK